MHRRQRCSLSCCQQLASYLVADVFHFPRRQQWSQSREQFDDTTSAQLCKMQHFIILIIYLFIYLFGIVIFVSRPIVPFQTCKNLHLNSPLIKHPALLSHPARSAGPPVRGVPHHGDGLGDGLHRHAAARCQAGVSCGQFVATRP